MSALLVKRPPTNKRPPPHHPFSRNFMSTQSFIQGNTVFTFPKYGGRRGGGGVPPPAKLVRRVISRTLSHVVPTGFTNLFNQFKTRTLPEKHWAGRGVLTLIIN